MVYDRMIECHEYKRGNKLKAYNQDLWNKRVFVRFIPSFFTNIQLKTIFEKKIGPVAISSINSNPKTDSNNKIGGFVTGFVTFETEAHAEHAIKL
jgi:hypothetical protein